jgi:hypothetical protein
VDIGNVTYKYFEFVYRIFCNGLNDFVNSTNFFLKWKWQENVAIAKIRKKPKRELQRLIVL